MYTKRCFSLSLPNEVFVRFEGLEIDGLFDHFAGHVDFAIVDFWYAIFMYDLVEHLWAHNLKK